MAPLSTGSFSWVAGDMQAENILCSKDQTSRQVSTSGDSLLTAASTVSLLTVICIYTIQIAAPCGPWCFQVTRQSESAERGTEHCAGKQQKSFSMSGKGKKGDIENVEEPLDFVESTCQSCWNSDLELCTNCAHWAYLNIWHFYYCPQSLSYCFTISSCFPVFN